MLGYRSLFDTFKKNYSSVQLVSRPQFGDAWSFVGTLYGGTFDCWLVSKRTSESSAHRTIEGIRLLDEATGYFYIYHRNASSSEWALKHVQNPYVAEDFLRDVSDQYTLLTVW